MLLCFGSILDHRCRLIVVKTKKWHMSCRRVCHWCFTTFWRLLWSITDQAHGNMESISIVQWRERKKLHIYIPASYHLTVRGSICAALQVTKATFRPSLFFSSLSYLHTVYPKSFSTPFAENKIIAKTFPNLRWQAMANFIKNSSKCGISKSSRTLIVSVCSLFLFIDSLR